MTTKKSDIDRHLLSSQEESPEPIRLLYEGGGKIPLARITETPKKMILPLTRLRIIREALNPRRTKLLTEVFEESFDERMISVERRGRGEAVEMLTPRGNLDDEEGAYGI